MDLYAVRRTDTIKFLFKKLQVMDVLFEETDKPVGLLEVHVQHLQFPDEKKQSKAKPVCLLEEHVLHLQFLDEKCNSMRFSQEITGEGRTLRGDRLALPCFAFFIRKWQMMDMLFEETNWLCQ